MFQNKIQSPLLNRMLVRGGGGVAAAIGCIALLGWLLGLPLLASLGRGLIPMSPSGAVLFVVYGCLLLAAKRPTRDRAAILLILAIFAAGAMIVATLFFLSSRGVFVDIEHFGIKAMGAVDGSPIGHMSPITAITFLLFSLLFPLVIIAPAESVRRARVAWWSAVVLLAAYAMLLLAYLLGTPMFYGGAFIPPAANTILAFIALGIALAALSRPLAWPDRFSFDPEGSNSFRTLALLFIFLSSGIISAGYFYNRYHEKHSLAEVERQLSAIADLKMSELLLWREERLWDAGMFYNNSAFSALVKKYLQHPGAGEIGREIETWVDHAGKSRDYYRIVLLDAKGKVSLSFPENASGPISSSIRVRSMESLHTGQITFADFYRNEYDGKIYLSIMVPLFDPDDGGSPLGVLAMRIDPEKYLYPFLQRWPNISSSAETLLVRREGEGVLFLNDLRFMKGAALKLRIPLDRQAIPSVMAALGQTGVVRGRDYRGKQVTAALRTVPDSPWYMVNKMDEEEIYAPLRERQWLTVFMVSAMLLSAAAGVGFVWRQQRASHDRHYLEQARRNQERLQCLLNVFQHDVRDVKELLELALSEAISMTASRYGYIYCYDEETDRFILSSWSQELLPAWSALLPETCHDLDKAGVWGEVAVQRRPVMVNGFTPPAQFGEREPRLSSFLTVPMVDQDKIVAVVGVANKETAYDDADVLQLTLLMGSVWKIAERKKAELALNEREGKLRRAEEIAHLGHWRFDPGMGRITWSDEMYRIFGLRRKAERISLTVAEISRYCHPDDLAHCARSFDPAAQEEGSVFEYRLIRPSGDERYVVSTGEVERNVAGEIVALFGTLQDTTELRQKERELEQKNAEMERFTYTVSHDLKSPLVTVMSFVGFLEKDMAAADSGRIAKDLHYMKTATERMSQLLDQILVMSRVGKVVNPPVRFLFADLVQEVLELVAGGITARGVLVQQLKDEAVTLYGDRPRLIEIWQNLIDNAVKYMGDQAAPRIEIGVEVVNGAPVFFVADNGMGIDYCYHAKIFNLFDKLDPGSEGTGLGLALVKRIVEMYAGKIWVESGGVGCGSCFRFTLPLATMGQSSEPFQDMI